MKIEVEIPDEGVPKLKKYMGLCGMQSEREFFNSMLSIFYWSIRETSNSARIYSEGKERWRNYVSMRELSNVRINSGLQSMQLCGEKITTIGNQQKSSPYNTKSISEIPKPPEIIPISKSRLICSLIEETQ